MSKRVKANKTNKTKVKNWLKAHGHSATKVNGKAMTSDEQTRLDLCDLHGVTRDEYKRAGV